MSPALERIYHHIKEYDYYQPTIQFKHKYYFTLKNSKVKVQVEG